MIHQRRLIHWNLCYTTCPNEWGEVLLMSDCWMTKIDGNRFPRFERCGAESRRVNNWPWREQAREVCTLKNGLPGQSEVACNQWSFITSSYRHEWHFVCSCQGVDPPHHADIRYSQIWWSCSTRFSWSLYLPFLRNLNPFSQRSHPCIYGVSLSF